MTRKGHRGLLGTYQILGGLIGVYLSLDLLKSTDLNTVLLLTLVIIGFSLNLFSIICGGLLFFKYEYGLRISRINQILQIFSFSFSGYSYQFVAGFFLCATIDFTNGFWLDGKMGLSTWQISINQDDNNQIILLNIIAILLTLNINKHLRIIKTERIANQLQAIGEGT